VLAHRSAVAGDPFLGPSTSSCSSARPLLIGAVVAGAKGRTALVYADAALGRTAMSTITIVVVGIWNALLLAALVAAIGWRKQVLQWVTELDGQSQNPWESNGDDRWAAFLAGHPELMDR